MVGAFDSGTGGDLIFNLDESDLEPTEIDVSLDPSGSFDSKSGSATLSGTVTCSDGAVAFIDVSLEQRVGRRVISGFGGAFVECDGTSQPWSAVVVGENGLFKGGKAVAIVFGEACGLFDCGIDFEETTVRLRR
jgi:hypothetical protein